MSGNEFIHSLNRKLLGDLPNAMNFLRVSITSLNKSSLKSIASLLIDKLNVLPVSFPYMQWYIAAQDAIESKIYKPKTVKPKRKPPENICKVYFHNKAIELINLPYILHDSEIETVVKSFNHDFVTPTVVYDLTNRIRSNIFNFKSFVSSINVEELISNPELLPCHCSNSPYVDKDHGHILTGNLQLVKCNKLRKILTKGPKYREPKPVNFEKAKEHIMKGIDSCISSWCNKTGANPDMLVEWKTKVIALIDKRIQTLKTNIKNINVSNNSLKNESVEKALKDLQQNFYHCTNR